MRLSSVVLLSGLAGCATEPAPADIATGAVYELTAIDGRADNWRVPTLARYGSTTMAVARGTLAFRSSFLPGAYEVTLFPSLDPEDSGTRFTGAWRQTDDGWVELLGSGTGPNGQQLSFVEGRGRPTNGILHLTTTVAFFYGAHRWTWRRVP